MKMYVALVFIIVLTHTQMSFNSSRLCIQCHISTFYSDNRAKAVSIGVQLILSRPEFHSTNVSRKMGLPMHFSGYTYVTEEPHKDVIYYMITGCANSFNILVPRSDYRYGRNFYQEYKNARVSVALSTSSILDIDVTGSNQVCDTFVVNSKYAYLQQL